jgi:uncharacterized protein (TIGR03437 family)
VDSGEPVVTGIVNAASRSQESACGAGALAAIEGRWLSSASTRVWLNGNAVPLLSQSAGELTFLCPDVIPGTEILVVVETDLGTASAVRTTARSAAPGLFSIDGSGAGQALAAEESTSRVAMMQNARVTSRPAASGDSLLIYATGVDRLSNVAVQIDKAQVTPSAIRPMANQPGVFQVAVTVPGGLSGNHNATVSLSGVAPDGSPVRTNVVTISTDGEIR